MSNNVLVTGTPRSGTTLTCHLLNKLRDTVALHEPMRVKSFAEFEDHAEICRSIERFCDEQRESIHTRRRAISKGVGGVVPDNPFGADRSDTGLRQTIASRGEVVVDKELSREFMLVIKHNSAFAAVLEGLVEYFPVYGVVRNPLATLASWSSVEFQGQSGHAGGAERLDPNLAAHLAALDDNLDRQIHLLGWFHGQFRRFLPEQSIIRYESVIESGGRALNIVRPEAEGLSEPLESQNKNKLYDYQGMLGMGERLLNSEGAYWHFYTRESVERLLHELKVEERGRRSPAFRFDKARNVARSAKAFLKKGATRGAAPEAGRSREKTPDVKEVQPASESQKSAPKRKDHRESLLRRMPAGGVCAEIGVWKGDFSDRILDVTEPRSLHLVDPWKHESDEIYKDACYGGKKATTQEQMDAIHGRVVKRFEPRVEAGTVVIHRSPSADAVAAFEDGYFDWIYIDGNHLYEFVKLDLELWYPKVKRGGYMAGDDYVEGRWWKGGVKKAVDEFAAQKSLEPTTLGRQFILEVP